MQILCYVNYQKSEWSFLKNPLKLSDSSYLI